MGKIDLTRFDFHALRFLKSENVEIMTAEEVGQFVLLMCHAWLGGKAASLPNNPTLVSKYARCERVSEAVMREWKVGQDGRLYNETLSEEWDAAVGRSVHGMRGAAARWTKKNTPANADGSAPAMPEHCHRNALLNAPPMVKPNQSEPIKPSKPKKATSVVTLKSSPAPLKECWKALRVTLPIGAPQFQFEWEEFYSQHLDLPVVEVMEGFIQHRQGRAQGIPQPFFVAKRTLESQSNQIPVLRVDE
jgi:hypothetical protein